ncbi:MAG: hypothetical protein H6834_18205 [Planctomycetes bacterium]|nr:hypothetical protein [Planctomycetota bacterium]MCB9891521.1 hypothetical protein [Planctomycetota bacterium]
MLPIARIVLVVGFVLGLRDVYAQVPNDDCGTALPIVDGLNGPYDTTLATLSPEPWPCAGAGGPDLWFVYMPTCNSQATFDTCGSSYDTSLEAFSGTCGSLLSVVCNDDNCGLQSSITIPVTMGAPLYVRVGGYRGATGTFTLNVTCTSPSMNDECASAIPVTIGSNGTFSNANMTTSAPAWPCGAGGNDMWFVYTAACPTTITVDTCSARTTYDTTLEVFSGTCTNLVPVLCNDDTCGLQSQVTFPSTVGASYYIRVGGYNGATGTFELILSTSGNGTFTTLPTGCAGLSLQATGSPNLGGSMTFALGGVTSNAYLWVGSVSLGVPLCSPASCSLGTNLDVIVPAGSFTAPVPCSPVLRSRSLYVQGAELFGTNGCAGTSFTVPIRLSDTVMVTIG